jgi:SAM-dependent methyltransferase
VLKVKIPSDDPRTEERIRAHYDVERQLAQRLREADKPQRRTLYTALYDNLYRTLPDHPQFAEVGAPAARDEGIAKLVGRLAPYLEPGSTFLEIGPGDCALSAALAPHCAFVHAVDVSEGAVDASKMPANFALHISDGTNIPVASDSVDLAFSDQLMEHLHPDDAHDQLREILRVLKPGGLYLCITPNRLSGPHDVSRFFSDVAEGFHIREYTNAELAALMGGIGFRRVTAAVPLSGRLTTAPLAPFLALEAALGLLPAALRRWVARSALVSAALGVRLLAQK